MGIDPLSLAAMGLAAAGSVVGGIQASNAANYQAKVAAMNAEIAEQNAQRAVHRSQVEAQDQDAVSLAALGELTSMQGASGTSLTGRSAKRGRATVRQLGRLDALRVRQAGDIEAYGHRTEQANFLAQAEASRMEGRHSLVEGFMNAGSSLISGASKSRNRSLAR